MIPWGVTLWLSPVLLFFCIPGCCTLSAPSGAVSGPKGGSLTARCNYGPGWQRYYKWWCRGAHWNSCRILVKSTGSEQEVKNDRVSIRDSHKERTFSVTMEKLREDDADFYWCGIEKTGTDLGVRLKVSIDPAPTMKRTTTCTKTTIVAAASPEVTTAYPTVTSQVSDVRTTAGTKTTFLAAATPEEATASPTVTSQVSNVRTATGIKATFLAAATLGESTASPTTISQFSDVRTITGTKTTFVSAATPEETTTSPTMTSQVSDVIITTGIKATFLAAATTEETTVSTPVTSQISDVRTAAGTKTTFLAAATHKETTASPIMTSQVADVRTTTGTETTFSPAAAAAEETTASPTVISQLSFVRSFLSSFRFLLPVFLKVPILLVTLIALLCVKRPQRSPREGGGVSEL